MSQRIAYYRVSTNDQSIESQRLALGANFDIEFTDAGVSGTIPAADRKGFSELLTYARKGDCLFVYAVDRLGRDAIDIQHTVRTLLNKGVEIEILGLGRIAEGVGELIIAVLAQIAAMERRKIAERTTAGRKLAKDLLEKTGKTQHGKTSLGRPYIHSPTVIKKWRSDNNASIQVTASHFGVSPATVKRAHRDA